MKGNLAVFDSCKLQKGDFKKMAYRLVLPMATISDQHKSVKEDRLFVSICYYQNNRSYFCSPDIIVLNYQCYHAKICYG